MTARGWFADIDPEQTEGSDFQWQPVLQCDGTCMPFDIWFATKGECEQWIKSEVLGQGMYDEQ